MTQTIYRANNPCALRPLGRGKWNGESGIVRVGNGEFSAFKTMTFGVRAGLRCLDTYRTKHQLYSPRQIISRWAPPSDNNPTASYVSFIARRCGVGIDDPIPFDYPHTRRLIEAIMDFELERGLSVRPATIDAAFRMMAAEEANEIGGYPAPYTKGALDTLRRQPTQRPGLTGWIGGVLTVIAGWFSTGTDWLWEIGIYPREALHWITRSVPNVSIDQWAALIACAAFLACLFLAWLLLTRKESPDAADPDRPDPNPPSDPYDSTRLPDGAVGRAGVRGDARSAEGVPGGSGGVAAGGGRVHRHRHADAGSRATGGGTLFAAFEGFAAGDEGR